MCYLGIFACFEIVGMERTGIVSTEETNRESSSEVATHHRCHKESLPQWWWFREQGAPPKNIYILVFFCNQQCSSAIMWPGCNELADGSKHGLPHSPDLRGRYHPAGQEYDWYPASKPSAGEGLGTLWSYAKSLEIEDPEDYRGWESKLLGLRTVTVCVRSRGDVTCYSHIQWP